VTNVPVDSNEVTVTNIHVDSNEVTISRGLVNNSSTSAAAPKGKSKDKPQRNQTEKQRETTLRKWEDDLKLREAMLTDKTRALSRAEANIINLESKITELNNTIKILRRQAAVREGDVETHNDHNCYPQQPTALGPNSGDFDSLRNRVAALEIADIRRRLEALESRPPLTTYSQSYLPQSPQVPPPQRIARVTILNLPRPINLSPANLLGHLNHRINNLIIYPQSSTATSPNLCGTNRLANHPITINLRVLDLTHRRMHVTCHTIQVRLLENMVATDHHLLLLHTRLTDRRRRPKRREAKDTQGCLLQL
jgi:hypothetical protein